jgi:hypothetical protein
LPCAYEPPPKQLRAFFQTGLLLYFLKIRIFQNYNFMLHCKRNHERITAIRIAAELQRIYTQGKIIKMTDDRIIKITTRLKIVFLLLICMCMIVVTGSLSGIWGGHKEIPEAITSFLIFLFIYIGLRYRKKWLIPLAMISSALLLISACSVIFEPVNDVAGIWGKIICMMFALFCGYQIHFFSKREVKAYFDTKDNIFF